MIVHIMANSAKHINYPFIEFVNNNFDKNNHFFILCSPEKDIQKFENAITKDIFAQEEFFIKKMKEARKIILHGIWYDKLCEILLNNDELFEKIYWIMWGGDFYFPEKHSELKKEVIKKINHCVTFMPQEFEYLKKYYFCKNSQYYKSTSFMYLSNIYQESEITLERNNNNNKINIQIGNSATPENMHFEIFEKLKKYKNENIMIYSPLSYGNKEYAKKVFLKGKEIFGDKFKPIIEFMSLEDYRKWMKNIDIGIFYNNRQQGVGNVTTLLGMGKKVYLRNSVSTFLFFKELGFKIYDFNDFNLDLMSIEDSKHNIKLMQENFSIERYKKNLDKLFRS
jgi:dTDP-N-acetylfucosamine:lipid II N-acetylfucosaminyltransferase